MKTPAPEIAVAGHICLDLIPRLGAEHANFAALLAPGRLVEIGAADVSLGGAVANTGLALHRLGAHVGMLGKVGDDRLGSVVLEILRQTSPLLAASLLVSPGESTSYTLVLSPPGVDRCFLHFPGANETFHPAEIGAAQFAQSRIVHFGYPPIMGKTYADGGSALADLFRRNRAAGAITSLDMAMPDPQGPSGRVDWRSWLATVLPSVDLFAPSFDEILFMLDRRAYDELSARSPGENLAVVAGVDRIAATAAQLLELGAAAVALKLGDEGLYFRTGPQGERLAIGPPAPRHAWKNRELLAPCFAVELVGATGSGDATVAGLLHAITRGVSADEAVLAAVGVGAASVERANATSGVPPWNELACRIPNWPQRPTHLKFQTGDWRRDRTVFIGPHDAESAE